MNTRKRTHSKITTTHRVLDTITQGEEVGHIPGPRSSILDVVKKELFRLGHYCMISLENYPIDIAHVIPKATPKLERDMLEAAWNTELDSLDVNSLENLTYLRADLHRSFDDGHWALMPKLAHISRIAGEQKVNDLVRQGGEEGQDLFFMFSTWLGKKVFEYQFLWLGSADYATNPPLLRRRTALPEAPYTPCDGERPEIRDALKRLQIRNAELIADKERLRPKPSGLDEAPTTSNTSNGAYPNLDAMDDAALRKEYATLLAETQDLYLHCAKLESENTHLRMRVADPSQAPLDNTTDPREPHLLDHLTYYRVFGPPYTDLPIIESRVHPFFIIFNAGAKLSGVVNPRKFGLVALQILELYNRWRCPLPSTGLYTGGSNQGGPYDDGQTRTTSQTSDLDGSSVASGSQREGARKSARLLAKEADKAREAKEQTPPRDEDMSPHDSSEGTPSLVHDSSSNAPAPQTWAKTPSPRPPVRSKIGLPTPTLPPPSTRNR